MENDQRFTWTYGPHSKNTIFINDNSLPNPKERGIAGINCHQIGNEMAERLAKAWCRALDMLALLEGILPIIEAEAAQRDEAPDFYGKVHPYWSEMRDATNAISREITLAYGHEPETAEPELCPHGYGFDEYCAECKYKLPDTCPHAFAKTGICCECGADVAALERSMKR